MSAAGFEARVDVNTETRVEPTEQTQSPEIQQI